MPLAKSDQHQHLSPFSPLSLSSVSLPPRTRGVTHPLPSMSCGPQCGVSSNGHCGWLSAGGVWVGGWMVVVFQPPPPENRYHLNIKSINSSRSWIKKAVKHAAHPRINDCPSPPLPRSSRPSLRPSSPSLLFSPTLLLICLPHVLCFLSFSLSISLCCCSSLSFHCLSVHLLLFLFSSSALFHTFSVSPYLCFSALFHLFHSLARAIILSVLFGI